METLEQRIEKLKKEFTDKIEALSKEIPYKHEFAKGWNYVKSNYYEYLALDPSLNDDGRVLAKIHIHLDSKQLFAPRTLVCGIENLASHRPATPSEIKDALVKVCERMGIVKGAKVERSWKEGHWNDRIVKLNSDYATYSPGSDSLALGCSIVYCQGQFATVVKEEEIKIGGYKCEWIKDKSILKVGCKEIPYRWVADLRGSMQNFKINHVTIEHEEIELETIVKILNLRDK